MGNHICDCLWELLTDDRAYFVLCFCTDGGSGHGGKTHLLLGSTFVYGCYFTEKLGMALYNRNPNIEFNKN